jgi:4-hydroxy-tetrahydrodipicolinate synthase
LGRTHPDFFNALWAGEREKALELGKLDERIMQDWFLPDYTAKFGSAQAIFKAALNLQGLPGGFPRRPILPLAEGEVALLRHTLGALGRL